MFYFSVFVFNVLISTSSFCFLVLVLILIFYFSVFFFKRFDFLLAILIYIMKTKTKTDSVDHHALLEDQYCGSRCPCHSAECGFVDDVSPGKLSDFTSIDCSES